MTMTATPPGHFRDLLVDRALIQQMWNSATTTSGRASPYTGAKPRKSSPNCCPNSSQNSALAKPCAGIPKASHIRAPSAGLSPSLAIKSSHSPMRAQHRDARAADCAPMPRQKSKSLLPLTIARKCKNTASQSTATTGAKPSNSKSRQ